MTVHFAHDGKSGLTTALSGLCDLIFLEVTVQELTGLRAIKQLRARSWIGVMILSTGRRQADKIVTLECGADDHLAKPFSPRELIARMRALSRRLKVSLIPDFISARNYLELGDVPLD